MCDAPYRSVAITSEDIRDSVWKEQYIGYEDIVDRVVYDYTWYNDSCMDMSEAGFALSGDVRKLQRKIEEKISIEKINMNRQSIRD